MTIYVRLVSVGLTIGLGGCLNLGQPTPPQGVAAAAVAYDDAFEPEPDPIPQAASSQHQFVEPSRVLAGTGVKAPKPKATRAPRQRLAAIATDGSAHISVPGVMPWHSR